ncbi:MAG: murein biosynthesis integral membrane protein MurJ [Treponema sp.]|nr:murein biosynthesis integral membrane protein MurJ [Treponema sp.]
MENQESIGPKEEDHNEGQKNEAGRALIRHGSMLSLLTLISRVLGLVREMTKASLLGTTALSDAFSVAFMIPNLLRRLFAEGSIAAAFIPTFKEYLLEADKKKTKEFLCCFFTFLTFAVTLTVMIGILITPLVVPLFGLEEFDETVFLTRLMFPFLALISIAAFFQGILNSLKIFSPSGLAPILLNIAAILCAYGLKDHVGNPARAMAVGILIGGFLECAIQLPFVLKEGQRFFFTGIKKAFFNAGTRKVLILIGPTILGMAAYQINDLVSTALAGNAGEGVVSSLQYSLRMQELLLGIFAVSIGTVLLPDLAEHAKSLKWDIFTERLVSALNIIAFITIPITFFFIARGASLIRLLFESHSFNEESVSLTLRAFNFHMPGLYFIALNRILAPAFYAQSNSKSPTFAGLISFGVNIAAASILVGPFKGSGIAFALSLASFVNTVFLLIFLKKNPMIPMAKVLKSAIFYSAKLILLSAIAVIPILFIGPHLETLFSGHGRIISLGLPLMLLAILYAAVGVVLLLVSRDKQLFRIIKMLKKSQ